MLDKTQKGSGSRRLATAIWPDQSHDFPTLNFNVDIANKPMPVTFDTNQGEIALPMGLCALSAGDASLHIETEAETQRDANRLNHVVGSHLERFAFRENPKIDWVETQKT